MNIIFGDAVKSLSTRHVVLELDTFQRPDNSKITAYCVVEKIVPQEVHLLESIILIHNDMMTCYKQQLWDKCIDSAQELLGKFNGEVDSFYEDLVKRAKKFKANPPDGDWDGSRPVYAPVSV